MSTKHTSYSYRILSNLKELQGKTVIEVIDLGLSIAIITTNTILLVNNTFGDVLPFEELIEDEKTKLFNETKITIDQIIP